MEVGAELAIKDDHGHYTDNMKRCVIQLMGESDVAAGKVGQVIRTVTTQLMGKPVEIKDLPSKTTALRYADMGLALTKLQIVEELTSQPFDLHTDGTTRDHRKFVGYQATLGDQRQLSMGFVPVDREDSDTKPLWVTSGSCP
jgi:hypothetical protein